MNEAYEGSQSETLEAPAQSVNAGTADPLCGVKGWLKLFVVVNLYIAPVIVGIQMLLAFLGFAVLAGDNPAFVAIGLLQSAVTIFLVVKWINIARRLRDIVPGVVQEAKTWLVITLAWNVLGGPLSLLGGMEAGDVMPGVMRQAVLGGISFAIWYSYFSVAKRVKATYPDWDA